MYDETGDNTIAQNVAAKMFGFMGLAQKELLITNAYIIPGQPSIDFHPEPDRSWRQVRILTNSLASHDVPAVNSHYKGWRDDLINAGAELYELRADPAIQSIVDVPPVKGEFVGLHTKAVVVDREYVFVGSMNFDPRSFNINTEAGAFVRSPGLAEDLAGVMERDMQPGKRLAGPAGREGQALLGEQRRNGRTNSRRATTASGSWTRSSRWCPRNNTRHVGTDSWEPP